MTHPDRPIDIGALADAVADRVVTQILGSPSVIDAIAERLAAHLGAPPPNHDAPPDDPRTPLADSTREAAAAALAEQVQRDYPHLVDGDDPLAWARAVTLAAGDSAGEVIAWAMSPKCATPTWRALTDPLPAPRTGARARPNLFTQIVVEHSIAQKVPEAPAHIDRVVAGIRETVRRVSGEPSRQRDPQARKAALEILRSHDFDSTKIVTIVDWGMRSRAYWRNKITGVPTRATFKNLHGDWVSAGNDEASSVPEELRAPVEHLEKGWRHYYAQRINTATVSLSAATRNNLAACLSGSDGADPMAVDELERFIRWVCDRQNRHGAFLLNGSADFPHIQKVRRGLIAMTEKPARRSTSSQVTETNTAAAAGIVYGTAVQEV
ncbi:hypothetical protein [Gordonia alkanivorans]|uniref:hypothetical protein n=1 Tax=Gordonia alkanivorans TaxID=84096 RepID=UPI0004B9E706|nr:hypothetical protein [Gordonia alkanivorans]